MMTLPRLSERGGGLTGRHCGPWREHRADSRSHRLSISPVVGGRRRSIVTATAACLLLRSAQWARRASSSLRMLEPGSGPRPIPPMEFKRSVPRLVPWARWLGRARLHRSPGLINEASRDAALYPPWVPSQTRHSQSLARPASWAGRVGRSITLCSSWFGVAIAGE
jgi:hypothetical protein